MRRAASRLLFLFPWVLLFAAGPLIADTIVLKNGRRIWATRVFEKDGKIGYETATGSFSLSAVLVDHIDRGTGEPDSEFSASIAPPSTEAGPARELDPAGEISRRAVHDGAIDREYIAILEIDARQGKPESGDAAAMAHHAAAQFELGRGDIEKALGEEKAALIYAPEQPGLLMTAGYLHLRLSEYKQALNYLEKARLLAPHSPDVAKLAGWAYYRSNKIEDAVREWKRSLALRADPDVQAALDKALRDKQEEANYAENESAHFTLKYSGEAAPELARAVLRTLEGHFSSVEAALNYTPPDRIGVVLYTQQAFGDITRAPGWAGALNDGRLRIPVQGLSSVSPELSRVLKHELTHSFLTQTSRGLCPVWLNEGLAQYLEGARSGMEAAALIRAYEEKQAKPLNSLEGSWMNLQGEEANYAYAWSLANVEYLVQTDGMADVVRILDRIAAGRSTEHALRDVLRGDYGDVTAGAVAYLRQTYAP
ncbi:MAG: hypothetical protein LAN71_12225 [Acidobacteriia bacterium]|nr:hypothetical protein [Terriglobia bacterium]